MKIKLFELMIGFVVFLYIFLGAGMHSMPGMSGMPGGILRLANAQTMSNGNYILEQGNLNSFAGESQGTNNKITLSSGELGSNLYSGTNYIIQAGFQYINSAQANLPLTFSISTSSISFGTLTAGEPITRTNELTVSNPSSYGYEVLASENNSLQTPTNSVIPDTTCDTGNCTEYTAGGWTSPLTYGFGYRCDNLSGLDCNQDFNDFSFYKQFANSAKTESAQIIMDGGQSGSQSTSQISYKINIPGNQAAGTYQNSILYIAIPTL